MICSKCGESLMRAAALALLIDAGCSSSADPCKCPKGGEHEFVHMSDCAVHNEPAYPKGKCDCIK